MKKRYTHHNLFPLTLMSVRLFSLNLSKLRAVARHTPSLVTLRAQMLTLGASVLSFSLVGRPAARGGVPRMAAGDAALIIQNKGGGHGEIGYHLALQLVKEMGMEVTVLHEGPNKGKPPHNAYGDLDAAGVKVIWCDDLKDSAACLGALGGASFGAVVDNWSKSPEDIAPYADAATAWGVKHYAYVSSAGMYTPAKGEFGAITEMCAVKSSGQRQARAPSHLPRPCLAPASPLPRICLVPHARTNDVLVVPKRSRWCVASRSAARPSIPGRVGGGAAGREGSALQLLPAAIHLRTQAGQELSCPSLRPRMP